MKKNSILIILNYIALKNFRIRDSHIFMPSPKVLLNAAKIRASKELGQNFLANPSSAEMIVRKSFLSPEDVVLEIGAGLGALTIPLSRTVKKVYAVEKDRRVATVLNGELVKNNIRNVEIINQDVLKIDLAALSGSEKDKIIAMGNLPYNISSQILIELVKNRHLIDRAVIMLQKELAHRITTPPGNKDYSRLSVILQYCAHLKILAGIKASQFFPRPGVASSVLEIHFMEPLPFPAADEKMLFQIVAAAFGKRRKTLKNALSKSRLPVDADTVTRVLETTGIDGVRRAETLSVEEFVKLTDAFSA